MLISYIQYSVHLHILIQYNKMSTIELIHPIKFNKEIIKFFFLVKFHLLIFNVDHIFNENLNTSRNNENDNFSKFYLFFEVFMIGVCDFPLRYIRGESGPRGWFCGSATLLQNRQKNWSLYLHPSMMMCYI